MENIGNQIYAGKSGNVRQLKISQLGSPPGVILSKAVLPSEFNTPDTNPRVCNRRIDLSTVMLTTVTTWQWIFFLMTTIIYENAEITNIKTSLIKPLCVNYFMTFIGQYLHRYIAIWYVHKYILLLNLIDSFIYCSKNIKLSILKNRIFLTHNEYLRLFDGHYTFLGVEF